MNLTMMAVVILAIGNGSVIARTLTPADDGAVYASMTGLPDISNPGTDNGRPDDMMLFPDREFPPASANANMMVLPATGNHGNGFGGPEYIPGNMGMGFGRPDHVPPVNPPIDTPAFVNGLTLPPYTVQFRASPGTLPGNNFGRGTVVPVPAAVWLFGSGLLGLIGMARRRKQ